MSNHRIFAWTCCLVILSQSLFADDEFKGLSTTVTRALNQKLFALKEPIPGPEITLLQDGTPKNKHQPGIFSLDSLIEVDKVKIQKARIEITGHRVYLLMQPVSRKAETTATPFTVKVKIELGKVVSTESEVTEILNGAFGGNEELNIQLKKYWTSDLKFDLKSISHGDGRKVGTWNGDHSVYTVGNGIKSPERLNTPTPDFIFADRSAIGKSNIRLVVILDEEGKPVVLGIENAPSDVVGIQAVRAIADWRFTPAMKDKSPVPILVYVELSY